MYSASKANKRAIIFSEIRKSEQAKFNSKRDSKTNRQVGPRKKCKTKKGGNLLGKIARLGTKTLTSTGLLKKGLSAGAEPINSDIVKNLVNEGIKHFPELYRLGTSKIKNKNVRKVLESELPNYIVQEEQKEAAENIDNLFG